MEDRAHQSSPTGFDHREQSELSKNESVFQESDHANAEEQTLDKCHDVPVQENVNMTDEAENGDENSYLQRMDIRKLRESLHPKLSQAGADIQAELKQEDERLWIDPPKDQVIFPVWAFGFNQAVPIINLSKTYTNVVLYASSHLVILYNIDRNQQRILRGHVNEITCLTCSLDKRWFASGDSGPDSAVIIWDGKTGDSVRTMLSPHRNGVIAIQLTQDARYLATLSADEVNQEFAIWNWTDGSEKPLCLVHLSPEHSGQRSIGFKSGDYYHVATNSARQVIFYHWQTNGEIEAYAPPLTDEMFDKKLGNFVGTVYMPETNMALTATSQGLIVVWETDTADPRKITEESAFKKAIKLVPLHEKGITFITTTRCRTSSFAIVTGDAAGLVKFFDANFMLLYWYQNLNAGPISSISFANRGLLDEIQKQSWRSSVVLESTEYPSCSTITGERFVVEDFVVTTAHARMIKVTVDGSILQFILRDNHAEVTGLSTHPKIPHLAVCSLTGLLKVVNYETKQVIAMKDYGSNDPILTCKHDPEGYYIALGFVSGYVRIVDAITLKDVTNEPFTYGRGPITHVDFAPKAKFCAYADSAYTTTLLQAGSGPKEQPLIYVGRIRVHYRPITDLMFWTNRNGKTSRLFTLSEDNTLAEYDIYRASLHNLPLLARYRVEQLHTPLCFSGLPPHYKEDFIFMCTSAPKLKLLNATSFMCRKVVMAHPESIEYRKALPLPSRREHKSFFLLCMSDERLTLVMLPLDGDPLKSTNLMAHPSGPRGTGKASSMAVSWCGSYAFTAGGPDDCVHMWGLNPKILEERVKNAEEVKRRFYKLISPEFLHELKDYYYYSMLRTQGLRCLETRQTSMTIPITEIPFVMRAIGYYPTEEDIENMINEIKYSTFCETGTYVTDIDLDTFIQMYCNYRPHRGILYNDVEAAFNQLCVVRDADTGKELRFRDMKSKSTDQTKIPPEYLFNYLETIGEPIPATDLTEYLSILLGAFIEGGRPEATEPIDEERLSKAIDNSLPVFLDAEKFVRRILGMRFCSHIPPEANPLDSPKLRSRDSKSSDGEEHCMQAICTQTE